MSAFFPQNRNYILINLVYTFPAFYAREYTLCSVTEKNLLQIPIFVASIVYFLSKEFYNKNRIGTKLHFFMHLFISCIILFILEDLCHARACHTL